eukprot:m.137593 g.137593  ORF g.137593 m.137593 type:complete len:430 (+) comp15897_c2_seq1:4526-5815(+)
MLLKRQASEFSNALFILYVYVYLLDNKLGQRFVLSRLRLSVYDCHMVWGGGVLQIYGLLSNMEALLYQQYPELKGYECDTCAYGFLDHTAIAAPCRLAVFEPLLLRNLADTLRPLFRHHTKALDVALKAKTSLLKLLPDATLIDELNIDTKFLPAFRMDEQMEATFDESFLPSNELIASTPRRQLATAPRRELSERTIAEDDDVPTPSSGSLVIEHGEEMPMAVTLDEIRQNLTEDCLLAFPRHSMSNSTTSSRSSSVLALQTPRTRSPVEEDVTTDTLLERRFANIQAAFEPKQLENDNDDNSFSLSLSTTELVPSGFWFQRGFLDAIEELRLLVDALDTASKLNCLHRFAAKLSGAVRQYLGATTILNMDLLLPLFIFALIRADLDAIYAELLFLHLFVDESVASGETSLLITTLVAACEHLRSPSS